MALRGDLAAAHPQKIIAKDLKDQTEKTVAAVRKSEHLEREGVEPVLASAGARPHTGNICDKIPAVPALSPRTSAVPTRSGRHLAMPQKCSGLLFDHPIGSRVQRRRHVKADPILCDFTLIKSLCLVRPIARAIPRFDLRAHGKVM